VATTTPIDLGKYNDSVLSFGSPPAKYDRELIGF
jgi:hypothetical protein